MKKKTLKTIIKIIIIILIIVIVFFLGRKSGLSSDVSNTSTQITEEIAEKRTIQKSLSSSGEIASAETEKLVPSTSKYFKTMCVEEDDTVKEGENILQYSDGTYMTAEYDCVVISYSVPTTGSKCTSSNYIEVQTLENLTMTISVNENQINYLSVGQEVTIVPTVDTTKTYTGTVSKIDSVGSYQSSGTTYSVKIDFENDGDLKIGMSASCTIILDEVADVVTVPIDAVQIDDTKRYVIKVNEDGSTENVEVETGISNDDYVEIKSGLQEGDKVQVITTTTQSTIRSDSSESGGRGDNQRGQGGMSEGMPSGMSGGMPSGTMSGGQGQMPEMPSK